MTQAMEKCPDDASVISRHLSVLPSFYADKKFVFLEMHHPNVTDYDDYRAKRMELLRIACGAVRNREANLTKLVGIAIDAPKHNKMGAEDFLLLECAEWKQEQREEIEKANKPWKFLESSARKLYMRTVSEFPTTEVRGKRQRIPRNGKCPCKSGRNYKNCCGADR